MNQPSDFTKTVGAQIQQHLDKGLTQEDDLREYSIAMMTDMTNQIYAFKDEVLKSNKYEGKDFYIVSAMGRNPMTGQLGWRLLPERTTPPTPMHGDVVYRYNHLSQEFNFLWRIPLKERYYHVLKYWANYRNSAKKEHQELAKFVAEIQSGRLEKLIDKMCGNKKNAVISVTPKDSE